MKVLILGGTGAMGVHLCDVLAKKGVNITVTTRQKSFLSNGIKYIQGNAKSDEFLTSLLQEHWDCIVDFMSYSTPEFQQRLPILLDNTNQYIFLSSARVYANLESPLTENSPRLLDVSQDEQYLLTDEYALAKARQENLLINSGKKNWTIIRPYITYAEERFQLGVLEKEAWLFRALHNRTIVFCDEILHKTTTLTYGADVSLSISNLVGCEKAFGESFHITSDFSRSWADVLKIYKEAFLEIKGKELKVLNVGLNEFLKTHNSTYQVIFDRLYDRIFDNSKLRSITTTEHFATPEVGIKSALSKFLDNPKFLQLSGRGEGKRDYLTNEITPLKYFSGFKEKALYLSHRYYLIN